MSDLISPLQMTRSQSWAGLTDKNHMGTIFEEQPDLISSVMSRLFGVEYYMGLDSLLSYMGAEEEWNSDSDKEWYLKGDDEKSIRIVDFRAENEAKPGVGNSTIELVLEEDFYQETDVLILDQREFKVRVISDGRPEGSSATSYIVEFMGGDPAAFIPPALLEAGKEVSKEYSLQSDTLDSKRGGVSYTSPFKLRNHFTTLGKEYVVPGNMHDRSVMRIKLTEPKSNKQTEIWTQYAEWTFMCQWYREKNRQLMYGQSNKTVDGRYVQKASNGYAIQEGSGLREQISPAYKFYYTDFSIDQLEDILLKLSVNILDEADRHFVALTGEYGMRQFHRALEDYAHRFQPLDSKRVGGSGQNLTFGGQYREYMGPQGIKFTVACFKDYDNPVHNRTKHPDGGTQESYRYTILNFGSHEGKKNIRRLYPKGRKELMWYIPGSTSPMGPVGQGKWGMGASKVDGYELQCQTTQMLVVENPLSCAELIYQPTA